MSMALLITVLPMSVPLAKRCHRPESHDLSTTINTKILQPLQTAIFDILMMTNNNHSTNVPSYCSVEDEGLAV